MLTHHAELHNPIRITANGDTWYEGRIYGDKHTHGNHPFRDGVSIITTSMQSEHVLDGDKYVVTRNTIYKIIGEVREVDYDKATA